MDTYSFLTKFADSWLLLFLFIFFVGVVIWAFRPGSTKIYKNPAGIPFRHEKKPAPTGAAPETPDSREM